MRNVILCSDYAGDGDGSDDSGSGSGESEGEEGRMSRKRRGEEGAFYNDFFEAEFRKRRKVGQE